MSSPPTHSVWNSPPKGTQVELDDTEFPLLAAPWSTPKTPSRSRPPREDSDQGSSDVEMDPKSPTPLSEESERLPTVAGILSSYNSFNVLKNMKDYNNMPGVSASMHAIDRTKEAQNGEMSTDSRALEDTLARNALTSERKRKAADRTAKTPSPARETRARRRRSASPVRRPRPTQTEPRLEVSEPTIQPNLNSDSPTPPRGRNRVRIPMIRPLRRIIITPNTAYPSQPIYQRSASPAEELSIPNIFPEEEQPQDEAMNEETAHRSPTPLPVNNLHEQLPQPMVVDEPPPPTGEIIAQPHIPLRAQHGKLSYVYPLDTWEEPRGKDPHCWYDNLTTVQQVAWTALKDPAVLVRIAYEGCPTTNNAEERMVLIESILNNILDHPPNLTVTAPAPLRPPKTPHDPPFSYLVQGIDAVEQAILEDLRCISTDQGTIFITPKNARIDTYLLSITGFRKPRFHIIRQHINNAFDKCGLNGSIRSLVSGHPTLSLLPPDVACQQIRDSLKIKLMAVEQSNHTTRNIAHIFMDPPTTDPVLWRDFRNTATQADFTEPLLISSTLPNFALSSLNQDGSYLPTSPPMLVSNPKGLRRKFSPLQPTAQSRSHKQREEEAQVVDEARIEAEVATADADGK
ncbi:hypothetical protein BDW22DRAFT_1428403 [Trametopsis cervina]|nr:hypothetical protein BDW22DRAFT_1428403 [Trametopsis cervina]